MSYTELYYVTPKKRVVGHAEFSNSWLGAMRVWVNLYGKHFKDRIAETKKLHGYEPVGPMSDDDFSILCGLFKKTDIPVYERAVLGSTFDRVILEKEHFDRFYEDVVKYAVYYPAGSLLYQVTTIQKLSKRNVIGVCWNHTSVNGDMYDQLKEWAKKDELWSLYKEIDRIEAER
jgi:hypothetical protein